MPSSVSSTGPDGAPRTRHILVWALLVGSFLCANASAEIDEGQLFFARFDGNLKATFARGNTEPSVRGEPRFVEGVNGKAVLLGDVFLTRLDYEIEGNFTIAQGTLSFWIKPIDWLGGRGTARFFNLFMVGDGSGAGYLGLELERFNQPQPVLIFYSISFANRQNISISSPGSARWANGLWHHVALTWTTREVKLFVDGEFVGSGQVTAPFTAADLHSRTFCLGNGGEEHTAIDELRIWNRPLDASEIGRLARRSKP